LQGKIIETACKNMVYHIACISFDLDFKYLDDYYCLKSNFIEQKGEKRFLNSNLIKALNPCKHYICFKTL